jgi:hypothetical protein
VPVAAAAAKPAGHGMLIAGALSGLFFLLLTLVLCALLLRRRARRRVPASADVERSFDAYSARPPRVSKRAPPPSSSFVPLLDDDDAASSRFGFASFLRTSVLSSTAGAPLMRELPQKAYAMRLADAPSEAEADVHGEVARLRAEVGRLRAREAVRSWDARTGESDVLPAYSSGGLTPRPVAY